MIESPVKPDNGFSGCVPIVNDCATLLHEFKLAVTRIVPVVVEFVLILILFVVELPVHPFGKVHV